MLSIDEIMTKNRLKPKAAIQKMKGGEGLFFVYPENVIFSYKWYRIFSFIPKMLFFNERKYRICLVRIIPDLSNER